MRINIDDLAKHPGLAKVQVTLDGEDVSKICFEADEDEGYVSVYQVDGEGRRFRNPDNLSEAAWEKKEGKVKIFLPQFK